MNWENQRKKSKNETWKVNSHSNPDHLSWAFAQRKPLARRYPATPRRGQMPFLSLPAAHTIQQLVGSPLKLSRRAASTPESALERLRSTLLIEIRPSEPGRF